MEQTVVIFNTESKLYSVVDLNISKEIWVRVPYIGSVIVALYSSGTLLFYYKVVQPSQAHIYK